MSTHRCTHCSARTCTDIPRAYHDADALAHGLAPIFDRHILSCAATSPPPPPRRHRHLAVAHHPSHAGVRFPAVTQAAVPSQTPPISLPQLFWPNRLPTMHTRRNRRHRRIDATWAPGMCAGPMIGDCREPQSELALSLHPPSALCAVYTQHRNADIWLYNARIARIRLARSHGRSGTTLALNTRDMGALVRGLSRNGGTAGLCPPGTYRRFVKPHVPHAFRSRDMRDVNTLPGHTARDKGIPHKLSARTPQLVDMPGYASPTCAPPRPPLFSPSHTRDADMHAA